MKLRLFAIIFILVIGIVVALVTVSAAAAKENEYLGYLNSARKNAENEVPYTACQKYVKAFSVKCEDESIYEEYLAQAKLLGEDFYATAVKNYVVKFPNSPKAYEELCTYYYDEGSYKNVISTAETAKNLGVANEKVRDYYITCFYMIKYVAVDLEEANMFLGDYALIKKDGLYGYLSSDSGFLIAPMYEAASPFFGTSAAVNDGEEWYMINNGGYKIARPTEKVDYLSIVNNGLIAIGKDGKYGYTNSSLTLPEKLEYDYASNFKNGVAAVQKNGKWGIINSEKKMVVDFTFEDILIDEYGTCINNGIIFAKKDGKYYMYNANGEKVVDKGFDDAYPFVSSEPAAVCINGKWGFVDAMGNMVIEPEYTEAKSFSIGLAPVSVNGVWNYINISKEIRVEGGYSNANPFSSNGIAAVEENHVWNYIKLLAYYE